MLVCASLSSYSGRRDMSSPRIFYPGREEGNEVIISITDDLRESEFVAGKQGSFIGSSDVTVQVKSLGLVKASSTGADMPSDLALREIGF